MPKKKKNLTDNMRVTLPSDINANDKQQYSNRQMARTVSASGSANITGIYVMYTAETLRTILQETLGYIFFPAAAAAGIIQSVLAWRQAKLDGMNYDSITRAVIETIVAAAVFIAVLGGIIAPALFAAAGAYLILGGVALKALVTSGLEIYYLIKYCKANTPDEKNQYKEKLITTGMSLIAMALALIAVGGVLIGGHYALAVFGIISGVAGGTYAAYTIYKAYKDYSHKIALSIHEPDSLVELDIIADMDTLTNNATMTKILSQERLPEKVVENSHIKKPKIKTEHNHVYTFSNRETDNEKTEIDDNQSSYRFS